MRRYYLPTVQKLKQTQIFKDMEKLKYEFSEEEVNFIIQSLDQVPVKGLQAINYLMGIVAKLQNPLNKAEYDKAKAKQITEQITGKQPESPPVISPEQVKSAMKLMEKERAKIK